MSTTTATSTPSFDLFAPDVLKDPNPLLDRLRAEAPVYFSPQLNGYILTRYDDITAVLKDQEINSAQLTGWIDQMPQEARQQLQSLRASIVLWMGHTNLADHQRIQRVFRRFFTPALVESMRPRVHAIVKRLLDAVQDKGEMEFVHEVAHLVPTHVFGELLGIPIEDRPQFIKWSRDILNLFQMSDLPTLLRTQQAVVDVQEYMRPIVESRRHQPQDDLTSVMVAAQREGQIHSDEELVGNCVMLMFGGHETTANLLSNAILALLQHPEQFEMLKKHPELIPGTIEEVLRYDGSVDMLMRVTTKPLELVGGKVPANSLLLLMLRAGSRDPEMYPNPGRFDITRQTDVRTLAFGSGPFYCLGTAMARMEGQICLGEILRRMPNLRPLCDLSTPDYLPQPPIRRRLESLRLAF